MVFADHGLVGGNHHHVQAVDLAELERLRIRGTRHPGQLLVETKVILKSG